MHDSSMNFSCLSRTLNSRRKKQTVAVLKPGKPIRKSKKLSPLTSQENFVFPSQVSAQRGLLDHDLFSLANKKAPFLKLFQSH
jgi:hypothetical protein